MEKVVSLRIKTPFLERIENSRGELTLGTAIRKIIEHSADAGESYLRNIMGQEDYYKQKEKQLLEVYSNNG